MLDRLTLEQQDDIIRGKPNCYIQGPDIKWMDDMWYRIFKMSENWFFQGDFVAEVPYEPTYDLSDLYYYPLSPSPGNPFAIEPTFMDLEEF